MQREGYSPPSVTGLEERPQPAALCTRTVTDQFGMKSTEKEAVSVVPETVWVKLPPPSLAVIGIWDWSIGLSMESLLRGRGGVFFARIVPNQERLNHIIVIRHCPFPADAIETGDKAVLYSLFVGCGV